MLSNQVKRFRLWRPAIWRCTALIFGSGGVAFVIGDAVKGGLYGEYPSLDRNKLDEGDLQWNNDFRCTYATLLEQWLGLESGPIVNGQFEQFACIKKM